jgi:tRNA threonylcarbamoyladenosine biosynthesis protein TsaE
MPTVTVQSERDTERLGAALADALPPGTVVGLIGTLGAGKTRLVQAVATALGMPPGSVTSPTFVLVNESGLTFVEWADRVADLLPRERVEITFDVLDQTKRRITLDATTPSLSDATTRAAAASGLK